MSTTASTKKATTMDQVHTSITAKTAATTQKAQSAKSTAATATKITATATTKMTTKSSDSRQVGENSMVVWGQWTFLCRIDLLSFYLACFSQQNL